MAGLGDSTHVAMADFTGDGVADLAVGSGPGELARVRIYDGVTGELLFSTEPFHAFTGGVHVAGGDITRDGAAELIVSPGHGGSPHVRIYHSRSFEPFTSVLGLDDTAFRGGVRVTAGDLNGDGHAELFVAAGPGGGPRVSVIDGLALSRGQILRPVGDFFVFEPSFRGGVEVASADLDGDGHTELIVAAGAGDGPRAIVLSGQRLWFSGSNTAIQQPWSDFFAALVADRGGIRVAVGDADGNGRLDVIVATHTAVAAFSNDAQPHTTVWVLDWNLDLNESFSLG